MSNSMRFFVRRRTLLSVLLVAAFVLLGVAATYIPAVHRYVSIAPCALHQAQGARQECVFDVIEHEVKTGTTGEALKILKTALPMLLAKNPKLCHDLAHRVGDITYYNLYIFDPDAVQFTYPPESSTCDYGFYHGFYEHFFQEHPSVHSIIETCSALPSGPEPYKRVIRQTCFHGAGHGLVLEQIDHISGAQWGDWHVFADIPLATCAKLTGLTYDEFSRCPLGVFAEIGQWRLLHNYGFTFEGPREHRFDECLTFSPTQIQRYCLTTNAIVSDIAFSVEDTLAACTVLRDKDNFAACVGGVILGLYINGADEARVHTGLSVCADADVVSRGVADTCYVHQEWALAAYFSDEDQSRYCELFPEPYKSARCILPVFQQGESPRP